MCAKKVRAGGAADGSGPQTDEEEPQADELDNEAALKIHRKKMGWREWVLYDFLRYWYWVGAIALVAFFVTQISWMFHVKDLLGLSVLAVAALAMVVLEAFAYRGIWPEGVYTEGWPAGRKLRRAFRKLRWRL